jgi:hypothetical protein
MNEREPLPRSELTISDRAPSPLGAVGRRIEDFWRRFRPTLWAELESRGETESALREAEAAYLETHAEIVERKVAAGADRTTADLEATRELERQMAEESERRETSS